MAEKPCNLLKNGGGTETIYSTDEVQIGYVSINGTRKALYQKTYVKIANPTSNTWVSFEDISSLNIEDIYEFSGSCHFVSSYTILPIPYIDASNHIYIQRYATADRSTDVIYINSTMGNRRYIVTLKYTKI